MPTIKFSADTSKVSQATNRLADQMQREFEKLRKSGKITDATFDKLSMSTSKVRQNMGTMTANARKAETQFRRVNRASDRLAASMRSKLGPALAAFVGIAGAKRIAGMAMELTAYAEEVGILADAAGVGTEKFDAFAQVTETVGLNAQQSSKFLNDLRGRVQEAATSGTGILASTFADLGLGDIGDLAGLDSLQMLDEIISRSERAGLSVNELNLLLRQVNTRAAGRIGSLLEQAGSVEELRRLMAEARADGGVSDEDAAKAAEIQARWVAVARRLKEVFLQDALTAAGWLIDAAEFLADVFDGVTAGVGADAGVEALEARAAQIREDIASIEAAGGFAGALQAELRAVLALLEAARERETSGGGGVERPTLTPGGGTRGDDDALERLRRSWERLRHEMDPNAAALDEYTSRMEMLLEARQRGIISEEELSRASEHLSQRLDEATAHMDPVAENLSRMTGVMKDEFLNALGQMARGASGLKDHLLKVVQDMALSHLQATLFDPIGDILFGGIFGRHAGGPVAAGRPYMVGEHGPEVFTPDISGQIIPSGAGGSRVTIGQIVVQAPEGTEDPVEFGEQVGTTIIGVVQDQTQRGGL